MINGKKEKRKKNEQLMHVQHRWASKILCNETEAIQKKRRYYKCHLYKVLEQASLIEDDRNQNSVCL